MKKTLYCTVICVLSIFYAHAQDHKEVDKVPQDKKEKTYSELFKEEDFRQKGFITIHKVKEDYFFEIPDTLIKKEILTVTRYKNTPEGAKVYGGELVGEQVVYFDKGPNNKILLKGSIDFVLSDSTNVISKAIENSSSDPILASFDILAENEDSTAIVVKMTKLLSGDDQVFSLSSNTKKILSVGNFISDNSFIKDVKAFPTNIEIHTVKTYQSKPKSPINAIPSALSMELVTFELNTSFIMLPDDPMMGRIVDERVGYFRDHFVSYSDNSQRTKDLNYIVKWRLEPKEEDLEKYMNGTLVEPKKPIVYYIDPATPKKWVPYLIQGVEDWNKAFEKAGFKNAIKAYPWPSDNPDMSLEDARYSVIRYYASPIPNAYGPNIHDPRTGEILESHIGWYHNVMSVLHDWYMVQAGAIDPEARKMQFSDELMGSLIRFVSSHEIGHTLGLTHNMGASSATPVEKLRDKDWVEANGHTVSIMDYARFNYVAQPEDSISRKGIFPRIGEYDEWAIEWGYRYNPKADTPEEDRLMQLQIADERLANNPRLWFGGEGIIGDPRSQTEDLGDNSMKANTYGVLNLKRVMKGLPKWTYERGDFYNNYKQLYKAVNDQFKRYYDQVAKNIGGIEYTVKTVDDSGTLFKPVAYEKQIEAISYLDEHIFNTPLWLCDPDIVSHLGIRPISHIRKLQEDVLDRIISPALFLQIAERANRAKDDFTVDFYLTELRKRIFSELDERKAVDVYRRGLQKIYFSKLEEILDPKTKDANPGGLFQIIEPSTENTDIQSVVSNELIKLKKDIRKVLPKIKDQMTKVHYKDLISRIERILEKRNYI